MPPRRLLWAFAAALTLLLLLVVPARAQESQALRVIVSAAEPDFPDGITFTLEAESAGPEIVEAQLLYGPTRDETLTVVEPEFTPGTRVMASHRLDTRVYYYPPGTEISFRWVLRDAAGSELTTEPQEFVYHDERFPWRELQDRNVIVYWYRGDEAFGEELLSSATRTLDRLQTQIGAQLTQPVRIYVYANNADMRSALQSNAVEWIGGAAWPGYGVIVGPIAPGDRAELARLIPHELSHQVLHQATENPYGGVPVWFDEGLAVHNQEQRDIGWDEMVAEAAREGRLIPLEALEASFPADPEQALLSYAQSRDVVEHIIAVYGEAKLAELTAAFASATPVAEALPAVLGLTVDELDAEWRATLPPQERQPPDLSGPPVAPPERFEEQPAGGGPFAAQPGEPPWAGLLNGTRPLATATALALCCVVGIVVAGAALLVGLRLAGVDKRP